MDCDNPKESSRSGRHFQFVRHIVILGQTPRIHFMFIVACCCTILSEDAVL